MSTGTVIETLLHQYDKAFEEKDYSRARAIAEQLLAIDRRSGLFWFLKGNAEAMLEKFTDAESSFQNAIQNSPQQPEAHMALGILYFRLQNFERAVVSFENASASVGGNHAEAEFYASLCYLALKKIDDFKIHFYRAAEQNPAQTKALFKEFVRAIRPLLSTKEKEEADALIEELEREEKHDEYS